MPPTRSQLSPSDEPPGTFFMRAETTARFLADMTRRLLAGAETRAVASPRLGTGFQVCKSVPQAPLRQSFNGFDTQAVRSGVEKPVVVVRVCSVPELPSVGAERNAPICNLGVPRSVVERAIGGEELRLRERLVGIETPRSALEVPSDEISLTAVFSVVCGSEDLNLHDLAATSS